MTTAVKKTATTASNPVPPVKTSGKGIDSKGVSGSTILIRTAIVAALVLAAIGVYFADLHYGVIGTMTALVSANPLIAAGILVGLLIAGAFFYIYSSKAASASTATKPDHKNDRASKNKQATDKNKQQDDTSAPASTAKSKTTIVKPNVPSDTASLPNTSGMHISDDDIDQTLQRVIQPSQQQQQESQDPTSSHPSSLIVSVNTVSTSSTAHASSSSKPLGNPLDDATGAGDGQPLSLTKPKPSSLIPGSMTGANDPNHPAFFPQVFSESISGGFPIILPAHDQEQQAGQPSPKTRKQTLKYFIAERIGATIEDDQVEDAQGMHHENGNGISGHFGNPFNDDDDGMNVHNNTHGTHSNQSVQDDDDDSSDDDFVAASSYFVGGTPSLQPAGRIIEIRIPANLTFEGPENNALAQAISAHQNNTYKRYKTIATQSQDSYFETHDCDSVSLESLPLNIQEAINSNDETSLRNIGLVRILPSHSTTVIASANPTTTLPAQTQTTQPNNLGTLFSGLGKWAQQHATNNQQ